MPVAYRKLYLLFLKMLDLALLTAALGLTLTLVYARTDYLGYAMEFPHSRVRVLNAVLVAGLLVVWHQVFHLRGLYQLTRLRLPGEETREIAGAVCWNAVALLVAGQIGRWPTMTPLVTGLFALLGFLLVAGFRLGQQYGLRRARRRGHNTRNLLLIGAGPRGQQFVERLLGRPDLGYRLIGYVDDTPAAAASALSGAAWLGDLAALPRVLAGEIIDDVVIALPVRSYYERIETIIGMLEEQGLTMHMLSSFSPHRRAYAQPARLQEMNLLSFCCAPQTGWRIELKRLLDLTLAVTLLLGLLPLLGLIAMVIRLDSPGPALFVQTRMGWNKRRFQLFKFRTMVVDAEARMEEIEHLNEKEGPIFKIRADPRITRVGRFLRKTSLDELPQLCNVILGDMSLVGPRPLSMRDADGLEAAWQKRRFSVKPGITCLWQVSGRSNLSFREWMLLDLEYIDRWSLALDFFILLRTIPAVLSGRGAV
ncbi:MAG: sugar transferase [Blastocatellia bacterium]